MNSRTEKLMAILRIGHDTSCRGEGLSLGQALSRVKYSEGRDQLNAQELLDLIQANPEFIEQWIMYSEDKRTAGGWYLTRVGDIGQVGDSSSLDHFDRVAEAVAEYVLRELDYWATV